MTKKRGDVLVGKTKRTRTGCGNLYTTVNFEGDTPIEVFVRLGKAGGCASSQTEALGRLISLALRHGASILDIAKQLTGIGCHLPTFVGGGNKNLSCADAVAKCIKSLCGVVDYEQIKLEVPDIKEDKTQKASSKITLSTNPCPDCGANLALEEGCQKCFTCGYTRC